MKEWKKGWGSEQARGGKVKRRGRYRGR